VEDVGDLEVRAVVQHQIATDYDMHVIRGRRRKHDLQFAGAWLHISAKARRQSPADHQLALQSGRQTIVPGQAGWEMLVVSVVPVANVAVVVGIMFVAAAMVVTVSVLMFLIAVMIGVPIVSAVVIVTIVLVVAMAAVLRYNDGRREGQRQNCDGACPNPYL
jgi:K+-sensing histidine kinase KdpD